jgi:hypothetical protein
MSICLFDSLCHSCTDAVAAAEIKLRFGLASVGYGGHSSLGTQSAKLTADSIGDNEKAGKKAWVC